MKVTLIQQTPNPIETISSIASICYDSNPADPMKLVKQLYKNGHLSVMEHIHFTFKCESLYISAMKDYAARLNGKSVSSCRRWLD